ncbi:MAG: ACT domain-containing protein [Chloroflexota bacterium]
MKLKLTVLPKKYAICRLNANAALPHWIVKAEFFSVTRTKDELSVVAEQDDPVSEDIICSRDWRILKIEGPLDLTLIGLIAEVSGIFKDAGIAIFTLSTYETDYILVKEGDLRNGTTALVSSGHEVIGSE